MQKTCNIRNLSAVSVFCLQFNKGHVEDMWSRTCGLLGNTYGFNKDF